METKTFEKSVFTFIPLWDNHEMNAITGTAEEAAEECEVICFDGISYFSFRGKYFVSEYKKVQDVGSSDIASIEMTYGWDPIGSQYDKYHPGYYAILMEVFGKTREVSYEEYLSYAQRYLSEEDWGHLYNRLEQDGSFPEDG